MATEQDKRSRIGKNPVELPSGVSANVAGNTVTVKGPKGSLERSFPECVDISVQDNLLVCSVPSNERQTRSYHGMARALLQNMVTGVSQGFTRVLEINGVGYRADVKGKDGLMFQLGYSHPIYYELPAGVSAEVSKDNKITLTSIDKELIGHAAAKIRSFRAPEPYKGKGIKYAEEHIRRKAGKAAAR